MDSLNGLTGRQLGAAMADRARAEWEAQRKEADERLRNARETEHRARLDVAMRRSQQESAARAEAKRLAAAAEAEAATKPATMKRAVWERLPEPKKYAVISSGTRLID